jgi:7-cyano-7-deazaguanine synthase
MSRAYGVKTKMNALVLLSGGMDSSILIPYAMEDYDEVTAITFSYGQKHNKEILSAKKIANHYKINHKIIELNLTELLKTDLSDSNQSIITNNDVATYVPFRNTIMLSITAGFAESWGFDTIYYGANSLDFPEYPDCKPEYVKNLNQIIKIHTDKLTIKTPLINMTKTEIIQLGNRFELPWEKTRSCYNNNKKSCGNCQACLNRKQGFKDSGIGDPIEYD